MFEYKDYVQSANYLLSKLDKSYPISIVLGSGLGTLSEEIENAIVIPYKDIPNFPVSTAPSHEGKLIAGTLNGADIIALSGRVHYYEGYSMEQVSYYTRVLKLIGVKTLILTNAAGGINKRYSAGDLMIINDHINFTGLSPLTGKNIDEFGVRFPDMTNVYSKKLINIAREVGKRHNINLQEGVYAYMTGPSYETPSEIHALEILGTDSVGMSTVPEAIMANHSGLEIVGISCITNMASGITNNTLTENEVIQVANKSKKTFSSLVKEIIKSVDSGGKV